MIDFIRGLLRWRTEKLVRHSSMLLGWMLLRAATQAMTVFLLTQILGVMNYGKLVSVFAIAAFFIPFVGFGLSNIVLRNGSKDPVNLQEYFRRAIYWWALTLMPIVIFSIAIFELLLPDGLPLLAAYAAIAVELGVVSLTELCARYRQAESRIGSYGAINAGLSIIRLSFIFIFFQFSIGNIENILLIYVASGLLYVLILKISLKIEISISSNFQKLMPVTSGLPLSLSAFAMRLQGEFNKPILAQTGFDLAGAYNVAQRAIDLAALPLQAIQESLWPRMYAHSDPRKIFWISSALLCIFAILAAFAIWLIAPLLTMIFGDGFDESVAIMRQMALLPLLQSFRSLLNFKVIQREIMPLIGWSCAAGALVGVVSLAFFVPSFGVSGAVMAAYLSESVMIIWLIFGMNIHKN